MRFFLRTLKMTLGLKNMTGVLKYGTVWPCALLLVMPSKAINTLSVSGSGQCWSIVTLENQSQTHSQALELTSIGRDANAAADARCGYTLRDQRGKGTKETHHHLLIR